MDRTLSAIRAATKAAVLVGLLLWPAACRRNTTPTRAEPTTVGFRIYRWSYPAADGSNKRLTTAVWYPAHAKPDAVTRYTSGVLGQARTDATPDTSGAPYPLIVWSHGFTGSGLSAAYLAEHLAARGFVVAAVAHNDPAPAVRIVPTRKPSDTAQRRRRAVAELLAQRPQLDHARYAYRSRELKALIDRILAENDRADSPLAGMIDPARIGAGGHSMGGYTVLTMIGCRPHLTDPRIKAAVLHSPAAWMWQGADYRQIGVPTLYMLGQLEAKNRADKLMDTALAVDFTPAPTWYLEIDGAHHASFADLRTSTEKGLTPLWPGHAETIAKYTHALFELALRPDGPGALDTRETLSAGDDRTSTFTAKPK